jgi:rhamnosyltransferase
VLAHNLGKRSLHGPRFHMVSTTNHSAVRRFYITRNRLWVYRKYLFTFPGWVLNDIRSFAKETVKVLLFEEQKMPKVRAILLGAGAALVGSWRTYGEKRRGE